MPWAVAIAASGHSLLTVFRLPGVLAITATDALVFEAALVTVAAPIAGAWILSTSEGRVRPALERLSLTLLTFIGVSSLICLAASRAGSLDLTVLVHNRVALSATAVALSSLGALCAAFFVDPLDAAGAALVTALAAAIGLIASGPVSADLSERTINVGLLASPLVAITSSASIDLLRSASLYQFSPLAHRRFEYPDWSEVAGWYLLVAGCCLIGTAWKLRGARSPRIA